jgi:hypothetical protein
MCTPVNVHGWLEEIVLTWSQNYAVVQATLPGVENLGYKFWIVVSLLQTSQGCYVLNTRPVGRYMRRLYTHHIPLLPGDR